MASIYSGQSRKLQRLPTTVLSDFVRQFNAHPEVKAMAISAYGRSVLGGFSTARCDVNLYAPGKNGGIEPLSREQIKRITSIATDIAFQVADKHTMRRIPVTFTSFFHTTPLTRAMNRLSKRGRLWGKILGKPLEPEFLRVVFLRQHLPHR